MHFCRYYHTDPCGAPCVVRKNKGKGGSPLPYVYATIGCSEGGVLPSLVCVQQWGAVREESSPPLSLVYTPPIWVQ